MTSADGGLTFKSAALDTKDKFSFTFDKPGTYKYFCSIHPAHGRDDRRQVTGALNSRPPRIGRGAPVVAGRLSGRPRAERIAR